jgi:hypothetical protein
MTRSPQLGSLNHGTIGSLKSAAIAISPIQPQVRYRGEAAVCRQAKPAESVEMTQVGHRLAVQRPVPELTPDPSSVLV